MSPLLLPLKGHLKVRPVRGQVTAVPYWTSHRQREQFVAVII